MLGESEGTSKMLYDMGQGAPSEPDGAAGAGR